MNPIYQAGQKFIDLSRITAIEPILWNLTDDSYMITGQDIIGATIHAQLHENPITIHFPHPTHPSQPSTEDQYQSLISTWQQFRNQEPLDPPKNKCLNCGLPTSNLYCPICQDKPEQYKPASNEETAKILDKLLPPLPPPQIHHPCPHCGL